MGFLQDYVLAKRVATFFTVSIPFLLQSSINSAEPQLLRSTCLAQSITFPQFCFCSSACCYEKNTDLMKIKEIDTTSAIAWSHDGIPLLATGSIAGTFDFDAPSAANLQIWNAVALPNEGPLFSSDVEHQFHALEWLRPLEGRPHGLLVGAFDNGCLEFWDVKVLLDTKSLELASVYKHTTDNVIKCLQFNPNIPEQLATGGLKGQILIWDVLTFAEPIPLGKPISPMNEITLLAWNKTRSFILASTSNLGFTSIWDLTKKKEILQLQYNGADFSHVAWHPTELTKLVTASQSDNCPLIMTWNLRTSSQPEKIMHGHTKGVLSLDWCAQDPNLLISAGKDNCTRLWNPILGIKLGDYPTTANWAFLTSFAPRAPDVFATASFDGKVIIQTLQDTSPPVVEKVQARDDNEFWSSITNVETQQATFEVKQAPAWLKTPSNVSFGFGSKLVVVKSTGGKSVVEIQKVDTSQEQLEATNGLFRALQTNNFSEILASNLQQQAPDSADWELLSKLESIGTEQFLHDVVGVSKQVDKLPTNTDLAQLDSADLDDDFFSSLANDVPVSTSVSNYSPSGHFSLAQGGSSQESKLTELLLKNKLSQAVDICLQENKLLEALVLALSQDDTVKAKVKNHFFAQAGNSTLSRLIFSALSKEVSDIIQNADISSWKEIAESIQAYYGTDSADFKANFVALGDRILANSHDSSSRNNALFCYLAGSALDKVSSIWLQELPIVEHELLATPDNNVNNPFDARYMALNAFTQKVTVYKYILGIAGPIAGKSIEPVCKAIGDFAAMTSSSGNFELALQLMSLLPDDFSGVIAEKERIAQALRPAQWKGRAQNSYGNGYAQQNLSNGHPSRYGAARPSIPQTNSFAANVPSSVPIRNISVPAGRGTPRSSVDHGSAYRNNSFAAAAPRTFTPSAYGQPVSQQGPGYATTNPYPAQQKTNYGTAQQGYGSTMPDATGANALPQASSKHKTDTEGWNDLPTLYKAAAKPAPRRTPAPQSAQQVPSTPTMAPPPAKLATPGPPPPPITSRSRRTSHSVDAPTPQTPATVSKYTPAVTSPPPPLPHGGRGFGQFGQPEPPRPPQQVKSAPPKNPYAPTQNQQAAPSNPAQNQYAPAQNPYAPSGPPTNNGQSLLGPPPGPFAAPSMPLPNRKSSQPDVAPLPLNIPPPKTPVNPYAATQKKGPSYGFGNLAGAPPAQYGVPTRPPMGPTSRNTSTTSVHGPPQGPPQTHLGAVPASPAQAPPSRYAPPAGEQMRSFSAQHQGPPTPRPGPPSMNSVPQTAPAPGAAPPAQRSRAPSHHSVLGHAAAPPPAAAAPVAQNPAIDFSHIKLVFTSMLEAVKATAPVKFEKHIKDMDKRLAQLFGHLEKRELVSANTIALLDQVATALEARDYTGALRFYDEIALKHSAEVGTWSVGVKRLIAISEGCMGNTGKES